MKKRESYFKIFVCMVGLIATLTPATSEAYTWISASNSPIPLGTMPSNGVEGTVSSASIDYCTSSSCATPHQLSVETYCNPDFTGPGVAKTGLWVSDVVTIID